MSEFDDIDWGVLEIAGKPATHVDRANRQFNRQASAFAKDIL